MVSSNAVEADIKFDSCGWYVAVEPTGRDSPDATGCRATVSAAHTAGPTEWGDASVKGQACQCA
jgi:hypothetical protein